MSHPLARTDIFDFTYGAVEELLEPILAYYPPDPKVGSPFFTGPETFGLSSNYKRLSSFVGDILFQAPRRHFLRETPKDFGEDSWNYLYREPRAGAQARMGSTFISRSRCDSPLGLFTQLLLPLDSPARRRPACLVWPPGRNGRAHARAVVGYDRLPHVSGHLTRRKQMLRFSSS